MNTYQKNRLEKLKAIYHLFEFNTSTWAEILPLKESLTELKASLSLIENAGQSFKMPNNKRYGIKQGNYLRNLFLLCRECVSIIDEQVTYLVEDPNFATQYKRIRRGSRTLA